MNRKMLKGVTVVVVLLGCSSVGSQAQGTFVNLDFEAANVASVPSGQYGGIVSIAEGLPGWRAYLGGFQASQIGHNGFSIGGAAIFILGPQWFADEILQGQYTALLQAQYSLTFPSPVSAAIGQTGQIPLTAKSLRFFGLNTSLQVTFADQVLPYVALETTPNYVIYGADISALAGQTGELRFTSFNFGGDWLDAISFSSAPVPEPNAPWLGALAVVLIGWRWRRPARTAVTKHFPAVTRSLMGVH